MNDVLRCLLSRQSVSPKRLAGTGPSVEDVETIVAAALAAPNHGDVRPWRFVLVPNDKRELLAKVFIEAKRRQIPDIQPGDVAREREKAVKPPTLLVVGARIDKSGTVPPHEQWISVGAAIHGALLAAHALGYGAKILSGDRAQDPLIRSALGLSADEVLVGFIGIGRIASLPAPRPKPEVGDVFRVWHGPGAPDRFREERQGAPSKTVGEPSNTNN